MNTEVPTKNQTKEVKQTTKQRGRPPSFNQDEALEKALHVFWLHGYEGTSMAELTEALGMNKPSIYAAFGNKEELFRKALAKYLEGPAAFVAEALNQPTAHRVVENFLFGAVEFLTNANTPRGCMVVQGALTCGEASAQIQKELMNHRQSYENALKQRFDLAVTQGDLPPHTNSAALAKYLATMHQGLSVQATSGATQAELTEVVNLAIQNWSAKN
ncbi:TetR/AcrR family transcriptional regulator [Methylotenera sp.]|uniref:TetR/AcrR family transcriptional regulator n=1 Tax=Methylotenera sp. TaxID=2051956 RepID=UPI0024885BEB|nr:TetR/AcrR family transcriptional regulator [Methylotenera sp.]MDI1360686.1 TetR/AcrR family transcriptional regulator [Methylotenera sp.]